jgi:hypothetical protein
MCIARSRDRRGTSGVFSIKNIVDNFPAVKNACISNGEIYYEMYLESNERDIGAPDTCLFVLSGLRC